jgi:hypothetical protein
MVITRTGLTTLYPSLSISAGGVDYLQMIITSVVSPEATAAANKFDFYSVVKIDNGSTMEQYKIESEYTVGDTWGKSLFHTMKSECYDITAAANCSLTHSFGVTASGRSRYPGYYEYDDFNPDFVVDYAVSEMDKCWVNQAYDNSGVFSPGRCSHCKAILGKNPDGSLIYRHQNWFHCYDTDMASAGYSPLSSTLDNCEFGNGSDSFVCDSCDTGYALNMNHVNYKAYSKNCVPDAECTSSSEGSFFQEVTYDSGITKKYCSSCPQNCKICDGNFDCSTCTDYATLDGFGDCNCMATGCNNCTHTQCDSCASNTDYIHVQLDDSRDCQLGLAAFNLCQETYGRIVGEVVDPLFGHTCEKCQIAGCQDCKNDYTVCETCTPPNTVLPNG